MRRREVGGEAEEIVESLTIFLIQLNGVVEDTGKKEAKFFEALQNMLQ